MNLIKNVAITALLVAFAQTTVALEPLPPYDWGATYVNKLPPIANRTQGQQILHFKTADKPYTLDPQAVEFVQNNFKGAQILHSEATTLRFASDNVKLKGAYIELGVCTGRTINLLAALNPDKTIDGFDSFNGLPEDWVRDDKTFAKGTFSFKDNTAIPPVLSNVSLFKGIFKDVIPEYVAQYLKAQPVALLHVDCDLYSATKEALLALKNNIVPGTIIVFDEYYNFPGFTDHEYKAFNEFLQEMNYSVKYLAYNDLHQQVVAEIVKK